MRHLHGRAARRPPAAVLPRGSLRPMRREHSPPARLLPRMSRRCGARGGGHFPKLLRTRPAQIRIQAAGRRCRGAVNLFATRIKIDPTLTLHRFF